MAKLNLNALKSSLNSLEELLENKKNFAKEYTKFFGEESYKKMDRHLRSGAIKEFETTFELVWKILRRYIMMNHNIPDSTLQYRNVFRYAGEYGYISNVDYWFEVKSTRNETVHIYDEVIADEVFLAISTFVVETRKIINSLEELSSI